MIVSEAITSRFSCRAFLGTPVAKETVTDILRVAAHSPSGGNLQPWITFALAGQPLVDLVAEVESRMIAEPAGDGAEYAIYPRPLKEPYRSRQFKCGEDMYGTIGIARDNKPARWQQFRRNYRFFDAPVGLFFFIDREMGPPQWADLGIYLQSVMLLAREYGLHTCPQEAWSSWHATVARRVGAPGELMLFCGMALGYCDPEHPINSLRTDRAALDDTATLLGFSA